MLRISIGVIASVSSLCTIHGQSFSDILWQASLGGGLAEEAYAVCSVPTGYLMIGTTASTDGQVVGNHGGQDLWLAHVDETGLLIWQRALGGTNQDRGYGIVALEDGGCVVVGEVVSNDGDISGNHGSLDAWVVRVDPTGAILWQRAFGGTGWDGAYGVDRAPDGGFLVTGHARSVNGDVVGYQGIGLDSDFWTLRLNEDGELLWQSTIGGSLNDIAYGVHVLSDGGAFVVGETSSQDGQVVGAHGNRDAWVCRLGPEGELLWRSALGGTSDDIAHDVLATSDGGALVVGETSSNNGDVQGAHGATDAWVVKLSASGGVLWQRALGGTLNDRFLSITPAGTNSYLVAGGARSLNGNASGNHGGEDAWLVLLDGYGTIIRESCFGGSLTDAARAVIASPQGGFLFAGFSNSTNGDLSLNHGMADAWLVRLLDPTSIADTEIPGPMRPFPNPASECVQLAVAWKGEARVSFTDLQGRESLRAIAQGPQFSIDVHDLSPGMYAVRVVGHGGSALCLLLKE